MQRLAQEMAGQIVGNLRLKMAARLRPIVEESVQLLDVDEQVVGLANFRRAARKRTLGVNQIGRIVVCPALVATVAVLVGRFAFRACAFDKAVGQKSAGLGVEKLGDFLFDDQSGFSERGPNLQTHRSRFRAVRAAVVVELDIESGEVGRVGLLHLGDQLFLGDAFLPGADHDGRAVGIVGTDIDAPPAAKFLESDPDVRLQILDEMPDMDVAVGIRQCAGHQNASHICSSGKR